MSIQLACPKCASRYTVPGTYAEKKVRCKKCESSFIVPYPPLPPFQAEAAAAAISSAHGETKTIANYDQYGFPNYEKYAEYTRANDWNSLCALNGVPIDSFGTKKELRVLPNYLEHDEVVFAITSGSMKQTHTSNASDSGINTWLVVLTSDRFLFLDHALLTKSVDTQSIRHDRVQAVSASQGWILGKITVDIGARTVVVDNCQKASVVPIASLANKWLAVLQKKKDESANRSGTQAASPLDEIRKLAELHSMGALTDEEFATAKAKLLASM